MDKLSDEIRDLRHAIASSALDDLSKIQTSGHTPKNTVKWSTKRERGRQKAEGEPQVCQDFVLEVYCEILSYEKGSG